MSKYNPKIHHRRSIRLKEYDYSSGGMYYITLCCKDMIQRFGHVEDGEMQLNELGRIAYDEWLKLPERFENIEMDVFQIMPNHMHGIFGIVGDEGAGDWVRLNDGGGDIDEGAIEKFDEATARVDEVSIESIDGATARVARTGMGDVVGVYKSLVARGCLAIFKARGERMGKLWHRNLWDNIIRSEGDYQRISKYIRDNPKNWKVDGFSRGR